MIGTKMFTHLKASVYSCKSLSDTEELNLVCFNTLPQR